MNDMVNIPVRASVLREAESHVCGDRDREYGPPCKQLGLAGEIKAILRNNATREMTPAEWEALDMIVTKVSRWTTGDVVKRDTCVDIAGYAALLWEAHANAPEPHVYRLTGHALGCVYYINAKDCNCGSGAK